MPLSRRSYAYYNNPPPPGNAPANPVPPDILPDPDPPTIPPCRCGRNQPRLRWQPMVDGRRHLRAECSSCGRFLKFVPQTAAAVVLAEEVRDGG